MKSIYIAAIAAISMGAAAPAFAQDQAGPTLAHPQAYVNLGYTYLNPDDHDVGELTGRAGLRLGRYWGVESEFGGGVLGTHYTDANGNRDSFSEGVSVAGYGGATCRCRCWAASSTCWPASATAKPRCRSAPTPRRAGRWSPPT